jgi:hypothetical protein
MKFISLLQAWGENKGAGKKDACSEHLPSTVLPHAYLSYAAPSYIILSLLLFYVGINRRMLYEIVLIEFVVVDTIDTY